MRRTRRAVTKKNPLFTLNITSMTDMFTILLVFLLQTYSATEVQIEPDALVRLPSSNSDANPTPGVKLTLSKAELKMDKTVISKLEGAEFMSSDLEARDNEFIKPLFAELQKINAGKDEKDPQKVTQILLQADRDLPYNLVRKVFYTASMAGFPQLKMITMIEN
ncbi:MAG: ExbD/TolR family protein [Pseudobdellovibrionaceae bacterium]